MTWAIEDKGYSQRRACGLTGIEPKTYRYATTRGDDAALRRRLRELASLRRRFGYRRLLILLRREGEEIKHKKLLGSNARSGRRCAVAADASEHWARGRR